jgi:hypothetical protein
MLNGKFQTFSRLSEVVLVQADLIARASSAA